MSEKQKQHYDFFVTVDLQTDLFPNQAQKEILEINAVAVNTLNLDRRKAFSGCCHPDLANFSFGDVMRDFKHWLLQLNGNYILVTDNYNTLAEDFPSQCLRSGIDVPLFATAWLNITEFWRLRYGSRQPVTIDLLLEHFGMNRVLEKGKRSSQCDAHSLAIVVIEVLKCHRNFPFQANERLQLCVIDEMT